MRIALVSPYSWTYPGGVTRHIEALARCLLQDGHHVRVLAPFDPPDRRSARLHRGAAPEARTLPEFLVPLGRTVGIPANGAVSNLSIFPTAVQALRRELGEGGYDVVHVHEPIAAILGWDALRAPGALVGTFHSYSTNAVTNGIGVGLGAARAMQRLHARIAVSEAAEWTARRYFGGRYSVIPNGVHVPGDRPARPPGEIGRLRIAFVGQAVARKGLPVLLRAFEGLREHVDAELVIVGAVPEEVEPLLLDGGAGVRVLGRVGDAEKAAVLRDADVLCAPSLGGESFGMVLTEAFAQGLPVIASDIAGYRGVVRDGRDGVLVPGGDAHALAEALRDLALDPVRRAAMAATAAERAQRYAWPRVADEVQEVYRHAIAARQRVAAEPATRGVSLARRLALIPADGGPYVPAMRLPSLEPEPPGGRRRARARVLARRAGIVGAGAAGLGLSVLALERIGVDRVAASLLRSSPAWVLAALAVMCLSMAVRALAWSAILRAALPDGRLRFFDAMQGTAIGVLMSATLPARLGEPARALIVARRTGRPRESLPTVVGTLVSQTLLNVLALVILGIIGISTVRIFEGHHGAVVAVAIAPLALLAVVLAGPALLGGRADRAGRLWALTRRVRGAAFRVREGLRVFRDPRASTMAVGAQLSAWALQCLSCWMLLVALGLDGRAGLGAAAAVLLAVNVTAVLPATPSNLGVFQAACVAVLAGAFGVSEAAALGYGIVLQAVEMTTAVVMGAPALLKEGVSWRDVKLRAMHTAPVRLAPRPARPAAADGQLVEA